MTADGKPSEAAFISEVFHSLSQPLTALHCTLDLALQRDRTLKQLRASVQGALESAERLRQRLLLVRALNDAAAPDGHVRINDLGTLVRELCEDMSPLFESAGRVLEVDLPCHPLPVHVDHARLMRALVAFVDYLLRYLPQGERLSIRLDRAGDQKAEMRIAAASSLPVSPGNEFPSAAYACEIELARRTFTAAGGEFELTTSDPGLSVWRATLPLACAQISSADFRF